ncbi:MAG TPA: type II toxin-antitoxin system PemK/MazF family toxin [Caldisericia bacterium]|nr:type II toxin-antitoxin system PemK/MazF family toxin [Caldisericia bacterium]HOL82825.1 type II toxin-antitoxin system PemK/MazF family toxin [Caldisericia bacterium]HON82674.1 type II toxin-antitoxin system PemK/MazF family toxin [Caldisericia bacterium]HPC56818.1 type II toxin-antitoxin system PemK/MazF family toxin [Caldisericia bacterium]HPP43470.1 type II toxin-antitoxin system PemK/MazF family toxin [Caldisericia bacterium]
MKKNCIRRGEIYLVDLSSSSGSEQSGLRPVLIIQNDIGNQHSPTVIIAAITSKVVEESYPIVIKVNEKEGGLDKESYVLLNQIRTIDKKRLIKKIGKLKRETMNKIDVALKISLGLIKI